MRMTEYGPTLGGDGMKAPQKITAGMGLGEPTRSESIAGYLGVQAGLLDDLNLAIRRLSETISLVQVPVPEGAAEQEKFPLSGSLIAMDLQRHNDSLRESIRFIHQIIDRVDLT